MSFLYRTTPVIRTAARPSARLFSTTTIQRKVVPDAVKEPIKKVDRVVSDQIVKGIDAGVEAKDKAAQAVGANSSEAKGKAEELAGKAQGTASKVAGQAQGKAEELKGKAKGSL